MSTSNFCIRIGMILFFTVSAGIAGQPDLKTELTDRQKAKWARFWEETQANKFLAEASRSLKPGPLALIGVNVIPMTEDRMLENQTVLIRDGKISGIGPKAEVAIPQDANAVQAEGLYLIPGLTEAHAHTISSLSQYLVYLTRGVTTIREMDGYPWMLKAKGLAGANQLLIPNLYVAGHILSSNAFDFYMTQVDTPEDVQGEVLKQSKAGYDFIKIHNALPQPLYDHVFKAAAKAGMDVIGHIPVDISVKDAVLAGQRTNEHFKSYLYDPTLDITDEDYVASTKGSDLWNTPTFTTYRSHLRGEEALRMIRQEDSLKLVPRWMRKAWSEEYGEPADKATSLRQTIYPKSREIFKKLSMVTDKFIAGTDTGEYALMVPGFTLHEEVRIFQSLELTPYASLKTATLNPAIAMRREKEYGTIEVGKRADFVVLTKNPLQNTKNLSSIFGVGLRGTWLHWQTLDWIQDRLVSTFSDHAPIPAPSGETMTQLVDDLEALARGGFPIPDYSLAEMATFFDEIGQKQLAARLRKGQF